MEHLEVRLFDGSIITFATDNERVDVDVKQSTSHFHYVIENGKGWKLFKNHRIELDVEKIDEVVNVIGELIDSTNSIAGSHLFDVILWDLIEENSLDWIPDGIHYFNGLLFIVFQSEETFEQYCQGEEVERSEYTFPRGIANYHEYDIRKAFEEDFIDY